VRLSWNRRTSYPEGGLANNGGYTLQGLAHPSSRLDLSTNYAINDRISLFADWTNIFPHPFHSDIVRTNYNLTTGAVTSTEVFPMVVRFEETVLSGGVRFNFAGSERRAAPPAPVVLPPPPPVVEAPLPPPPPPPPAPAAPERGG
jgi:hypothetical protein